MDRVTRVREGVALRRRERAGRCGVWASGGVAQGARDVWERRGPCRMMMRNEGVSSTPRMRAHVSGGGDALCSCGAAQASSPSPPGAGPHAPPPPCSMQPPVAACAACHPGSPLLGLGCPGELGDGAARRCSSAARTPPLVDAVGKALGEGSGDAAAEVPSADERAESSSGWTSCHSSPPAAAPAVSDPPANSAGRPGEDRYARTRRPGAPAATAAALGACCAPAPSQDRAGRCGSVWLRRGSVARSSAAAPTARDTAPTAMKARRQPSTPNTVRLPRLVANTAPSMPPTAAAGAGGHAAQRAVCGGVRRKAC
jgi:hypothetical protein